MPSQKTLQVNNLPSKFVGFTKSWIFLLAGLLFATANPLSGQTLSGPDSPNNLVGHGGPIKALSIGSDDDFVITGSFDYSAILWDISKSGDKKLVRRYDEHDGAVNAVQFINIRNEILTAGDDGSLYLWSAKSNELVHRFNGHQAKIISLSISRDEKFAASASWDRTVKVWDIENHELVATLIGRKGPVNAVLISPKGDLVFSGSYDGTITKWEARTGKMIRTFHRHGWGINVMKWMPGKQQILFGTQNGDVQVFDLASDTISKILIPHERPILALAISKDGKYLASGGGDGLIRVWNISDWSIVEELVSSFGPVWAMDFDKTAKKIFYTGLDDYAVSWTISPRKFGDEIQGKYPRRFQKLQDMSLGERQFARKCSICHTLKPDGKYRAGPSLFGIFGRKAGSLPGYQYSPGLVKSKLIWNENTIDQLFALGPQHVTPGSKMPLQKIGKKEKRDALIEYLKANTQ